MSLVRPNKFTECFEEEFQVERPVCEETVRKLIYNTNMLRALMPIGIVKAYQINVEGVSLPSSRLYQYADGAEITDAESPLNGAGPQNVPDMQNRYLRGGTSLETAISEAGGSATVDLTHTHPIGGYSVPGNLLQAGGDDEPDAWTAIHSHGLPNGLGETPLELAHLQVAFYLKINL